MGGTGTSLQVDSCVESSKTVGMRDNDVNTSAITLPYTLYRIHYHSENHLFTHKMATKASWRRNYVTVTWNSLPAAVILFKRNVAKLTFSSFLRYSLLLCVYYVYHGKRLNLNVVCSQFCFFLACHVLRCMWQFGTFAFNKFMDDSLHEKEH